MDQNTPKISDGEVQTFAFTVGKTIQNYGIIECLINDLIALTIQDSLISRNIIKMPVSKRIDILKSLINRDALALEKNGFTIADLFSAAKTAFTNRNKVAHNPFTISAQTKEGKQLQLSGIQVIRHLENESIEEEWIDLQKLESFMIESRELLIRLNQLLEYYRAKQHYK